MIHLDMEDDKIPVYTSFNLTVHGAVLNPNMTKPSDPITVRIWNSKWMKTVLNEDSRNLIVTTSIPYNITGDRAEL